MSIASPANATQIIYASRSLPDGSQVLIPRFVMPRTCRRLDGVTKVTYATRAEAKAAKAKHHAVYRCPNCGGLHLATKHRHSAEIPRSTQKLRVA